jgi:hypothetical protein
MIFDVLKERTAGLLYILDMVVEVVGGFLEAQ